MAIKIHGGFRASGVEPVVYLCAPTVSVVFGLARQFGIGHPGMFEAVEMQHAACLYLSCIDGTILVGVSAFCSGLAYAHHIGVGTERVAMLELTVKSQSQTVVPVVVQQEIHIVNLIDVCIVNILFRYPPCRHI